MGTFHVSWVERPINAVDKQLLRAAQERDITKAAAALSRGADVNASLADRVTALHHAAEQGADKLVRLLLRQKGICLNHDTCFGSTPLLIAAWTGQTRVARILLRAGAKPDVADKVGITPIHAAVFKGFIRILKMLIRHKANVNVLNAFDVSPLYLSVIVSPNAYAARILLRHGTKKAFLNDTFRSLVLHASMDWQLDALKMLVRHGADVNYVEPVGGRTPLHVAAALGEQCLVTCLIEIGGDITVEDRSGRTPLDCAVKQGNMEVVAMLTLLKKTTDNVDDTPEASVGEMAVLSRTPSVVSLKPSAQSRPPNADTKPDTRQIRFESIDDQ